MSKHMKPSLYRGYIYHMFDSKEDHSSLLKHVNGYIHLNENCELFGLDVFDWNNELQHKLPDIPGGWTFSGILSQDIANPNTWGIGFDTAHLWDGPSTQNFDYVETHLKKAIDQLIDGKESPDA